jgi:hypothetical protein
MLGNYLEESKQHSEHGESLKSRKSKLLLHNGSQYKYLRVPYLFIKLATVSLFTMDQIAAVFQ